MPYPKPDNERYLFENFLSHYLALDFAPCFEWWELERALGRSLTHLEFTHYRDYAQKRWQKAKEYREEKKQKNEEK